MAPLVAQGLDTLSCRVDSIDAGVDGCTHRAGGVFQSEVDTRYEESIPHNP